MIVNFRNIASAFALSSAIFASGCNKSNENPIPAKGKITETTSNDLGSTLAKLVVDTAREITVKATRDALKEIDGETIAKVASTLIDVTNQPTQIDVKPFRIFRFDKETFEVKPFIHKDEVIERLENQNIDPGDIEIFMSQQRHAANAYNRRVNEATSKTIHYVEDLRDNGIIYKLPLNAAHFLKILKKREFGEPITISTPKDYDINSAKLIRFALDPEHVLEGIYLSLPGEDLSQNKTLRGNIFFLDNKIVVFIKDGDKDRAVYLSPTKKPIPKEKEEEKPPVRVIISDDALVA